MLVRFPRSDGSRIWVRSCSTPVGENGCLCLPFILTVSEHQLEYNTGWPHSPKLQAGLRTYPKGRRVGMPQAGAGQPWWVPGDTWAGASAPGRQGRQGYRPAPGGVPCGRQGQPIAGHNNNLFLGFDLFSIISSHIKRSALNRLILPFFL